MSAQIELEREVIEPGGRLRGRVALEPMAGDEGRKVELSVLWETEGKGDTDIGVVLHRVLHEGGEGSPGATGTCDLDVVLPLLPVTFAGTLLKLRWLVRVRRYALLGDDELIERDFVVRWPA